MKEIQNKLKYGGEEYSFAQDTAPEENSPNFITSGGVFQQFKRLSSFLDKAIATEITSRNGNIPTSGVVYDALGEIVNQSTGHLSATLRQNVFLGVKDSVVGVTGLTSGTTVFAKSYKASSSATAQSNVFVYRLSNTAYVEEPQKYVLYFNTDTNRFCYWTGTELVEINP